MKYLRCLQTVALASALAVLCACPAAAQGTKSAEQYMNEAPITMAEFLADPVKALKSLLAGVIVAPMHQTAVVFGGLLCFLLLSAAVIMAVPEENWHPLLEMIAAAGSFLLVAQELAGLAEAVRAHSIAWKDFFAGFVPVFAAVTAASGQVTAATAYSGFFLMAVCTLAESLRCFLLPAAKMYFAVSAASTFSESNTLCTACEAVGKLLCRMAALAGGVFSVILGLQRVFASAADNAAWKTGKMLLSGAVPLVGQTLALAADSVAAGIHTLQAGLGFAAVAAIGAEFIPLYLHVLSDWLLCAGCGAAARLLGLERCGGLLECLAAGLEAMAAVLALFFAMVTVSTLLMIGIGNGG